MRRLFGGLGFPVAAIEPITIQWAWVGNVSGTGATIKLRSTDASAVTLRYSTNPGLAGYSTASGAEGNDDVWTVDLSGLTPNTRYYYGFAGSDFSGTFQTFPVGVASFVLALAGDMGSVPDYEGSTEDTSNPPTFDRITEHDPIAFMHLGDLHYRDPTSTSVATHRAIYRDVLANAEFADFVKDMPTSFIWDDHDGGPNNWDGTASSKVAAAEAYRDYVPHWPLEDSGAIYQEMQIGRVPILHLDARYYRTPNSEPDDADKTRLGTDQKQWLKDRLLAHASRPVIVVNVMSWWGDTDTFNDGWEVFGTERQELAEYLVDNALNDKVFLVGADIHELIGDDGTNTQFDPGSGDPGPPYFGAAPIDAIHNHFGGTFSEGVFQVRKQQYGLLDVVDTGSQITVTARGFALSADGSTSSEVLTFVKVFPG